jgi:hypothetical protein
MAERSRLENLYLTDAEWREAELAYQENKAASLMADPDAALAVLERQGDYLEAFDFKGSARDILTIMEGAYSDAVFSDEAHQFMQATLNWVMDMNPANREVYDDLGSKGGSTPSILTGAWYVTPRGGESLALALFYRNLPPELWTDWAQTFAHQGLELRAVAGGEGCAVFDNLESEE